MSRHWIAAAALFAFIPPSFADSFTHLVSKKAYTGYVSKTDENGISHVQTVESGPVTLNLSEYRTESNHKGRNSFVSVIAVDHEIEYEIETAAFETAIREEAEKGPLFILIEVDTPGGRVDLTRRLCASISELKNARTVAFIKGEKNLGAYSAGAAVSLACNKIYMAPNTAIGAATAIIIGKDGPKTEKEVFGETIGEKFGSAWRNYLAALAQANGRSGLLAKAMEDKDIVVYEVERNGKVEYVEPANQLKTDKMLQVFCKKGELLTLTPQKAVQSGIADGIASTRSDVLKIMEAPEADIRICPKTAEAREELQTAISKLEKLSDSLDLRFRALVAKGRSGGLTKTEAIKDYKQIIRELEYLNRMGDKYPDINMEEEGLQEFINSVKAEYESIKKIR